MGVLYIVIGLGILLIVFALVFSVLTIWFRNTAMRIISLIFTVLAFTVYLISIFAIGHSDEVLGISMDKLLFLPVAVALYLQSNFAMKSATKIFTRKVFFGLSCLIIVRLLGIAVSVATDVLYRNSLDDIAQAIWKTNSYVLFPLLFAGISYVFAAIFHPNLKVFKELFTKTFIILAAIALIDELLNILMIYAKYKNLIVYDGYTYSIILVVSLLQIVVGCVLGLYVFKNKYDKISV